MPTRKHYAWCVIMFLHGEPSPAGHANSFNHAIEAGAGHPCHPCHQRIVHYPMQRLHCTSVLTYSTMAHSATAQAGFARHIMHVCRPMERQGGVGQPEWRGGCTRWH